MVTTWPQTFRVLAPGPTNNQPTNQPTPWCQTVAMPNAAHSLLLILSSPLRASHAGACLSTFSSTAMSSTQTHIYAGVPTRCLPHVFHQLRHFIPYHCVLHMCAPRRKQPCGGSDKMRNGRHCSEPGPGCTPRYTPRQHPWCIPPHSTPPTPIYLTSPYLPTAL